MALPLAVKMPSWPEAARPVISTVVRSMRASAICEAMARFQMRS